jgi:hypothetical protein
MQAAEVQRTHPTTRRFDSPDFKPADANHLIYFGRLNSLEVTALLLKPLYPIA